MSSDNNQIILQAVSLSKRFQLGEFVGIVPALRTLKRVLSNPVGYIRNRTAASATHDHIVSEGNARYLWAVRDISFTLHRGEKVAVLGRNGAGKSTLLKLLTKIMVPTEGDVRCHARMVPLMGVGSGFNPELTGRENVYIYAALLGFPPVETRKLYDDIVAFSEIPEFMDTPLKRYSKGMRARLGMAVALNLNPEVLVVDEVLAVGDIQFRAKCMKKMEEMCGAGMTLLFVSHSPARVRALCDRAILIRDGRLVDDGDIHRVLQRYLEEDVSCGTPEAIIIDDESISPNTLAYSKRVDWELDDAPGDEVVKIVMVRVCDSEGVEKHKFRIHEQIFLEMEYIVGSDEHILRPQFQILNDKLETVFVTIDSDKHWREEARRPGFYRSRASIPGNFFGPRVFLIGASVYTHAPLEKHARTGEVVSFEVLGVYDPSNSQSDYERPLPGDVRPLLEWNTTLRNHNAN